MSDAAARLCRRFFCRRIRHSFHCLSLPFRASVLTLSRGDTMKKSVLMFSLLSGTALMFPRLTIASGLPALTHTYTPEPKPAAGRQEGKRRGYTYKDTKKGYPPATEKGRQGQTSKSTPVEYQDTLIWGKSQLLMKVQIFLSTNDGTT